MLDKLILNFIEQIGNVKTVTFADITRYRFDDVEILIYPSEVLNIGAKRNILLKAAAGKYVCCFDDDDKPSENYIPVLRTAMSKNPDVVSLRGIITFDGENPELFEHSLKYSEWKTTNNEIKYERYPNHLNCIRASIAKQFSFPEKNYGEDHDWSKKIHESGLLKTEYYTNKVLYHYKFVTNK